MLQMEVSVKNEAKFQATRPKVYVPTNVPDGFERVTCRFAVTAGVKCDNEEQCDKPMNGDCELLVEVATCQFLLVSFIQRPS